VSHCINDKFEKFLDISKLYDATKNSSKHSFYNPMIKTKVLIEHHKIENYKEHYKEPGFEWNFFNHHNLLDANVHLKFKNKCSRFLQKIENEKVCLVYINKYTTDYDDIIEFSKCLADKKNVYILGLIKSDCKRIFYEQTNVFLFYYETEEDIKDIFLDIIEKTQT
jgi:hypothetical protein